MKKLKKNNIFYLSMLVICLVLNFANVHAAVTYCVNPNYKVDAAGIGDRLVSMTDLIHCNVAFNKKNFMYGCNDHKNMGLDFLFKELPDKAKGSVYVRYNKDKQHNPSFYKKVVYRDRRYANKHSAEVYKLLNIDKRKQEVLEKYKVPKNYFDNSMSLHIRCGDTKKERLNKFSYYRDAVKYISEKTGANKVICFYENDKFSSKTASGIINKLKKDFPKIKFEKCIKVKTDAEEILMMSMCKHNIQSKSFFTKWATNFNTNPKKVIFKINASSWGSTYDGIGFCDYKK